MALVRTQVARAIRAARDAGRIGVWDEPAAATALILARQLDSAAKSGDSGLIVRVSKSLQDTLDKLPLREEAPSVGSGSDADPSQPVAAHPGGLAGLLGSAAAVGNSALPG